ncbi:MAG TPA: Asp-tRNA(Asn)/Glu-tRNA(Gln) amidotransferase subunit GatC [Chloroflexota bacterium]
MPIDRAAVEHVARLAHVGLTPEEVEEFADELSSVLDHMRNLQTLDTSGVEPTAHAVPVDNVMRDDEVQPSWPPAAILANAPHRIDGLFEVQAVLD